MAMRIRRDDEVESDFVAGREAGQRIRVAHGKVHRHRGHVAGNFFVRDGRVAMVGRNRLHHTTNGVGLVGRGGNRRGRCFTFAADGQQQPAE